MRALLISALFLISARAIANSNGITSTELVIGNSLPLTGKLGVMGQAYFNSQKTVFDAVNKAGGINGRKIRLISLDDAYKPKEAARNADVLVHKEKIFAFVGACGSAGIQAMMPLLNRENIPMLFPYSGADFLYQGTMPKNIFTLRANHVEEAQLLIDFLVKEKGYKEFGVFNQDDVFGKSGRKGVKEGLAKHGLEIIRTASHGRHQNNYSAAVDDLQKSGVQVVFFATNFPAAEGFLKEAMAKKFRPVYAGLSSVVINGLHRRFGRSAPQMYSAGALPLPNRCDLPVCKQFMKEIKLDDPVAMEFAFGGYVGARLFIEALKLTGTDLSREKLTAALENMTNFDLGGLKISFSSSDHQGLHHLHRYKIEAGDLRISDDQ